MVKLIDLQTQYQQHKTRLDAAISRVLHHGQFLLGPEIETLEKSLAEYVGVQACIATSSGTTALQVALMALEVQPGDEVITVPFSFFATAEVIYLLGAKPIYIDIDPNTYLMNVNLLEAAITERTKAIIPVSLYGQCAEMDVIDAIAKRHRIPVIEDAAQSFGATYKNKKSCGLSDIACTSFFPSKPLGGYGDSGACFTDDPELARRMRLIINHGQSSRYHHVTLGINGRMDTIQAAVLLEKFSFFETELKQRQIVANWYHEFLSSIHIAPPIIAPNNVSAYAQYTVQVDERERIQKELLNAGIPTAVHYPVGLHQQPYVLSQQHYETESFPVTEQCAKRVLSLPFHPYLTRHEVQAVCEQLQAAKTKRVMSYAN